MTDVFTCHWLCIHLVSSESLLLFIFIMQCFVTHIASSPQASESQSAGAYFHSGLALQHTLQMAELMLHACMERLDQQEEANTCSEGGQNDSILEMTLHFFSVVLPSIRVIFDWFLCQEELCEKSAQHHQTLL